MQLGPKIVCFGVSELFSQERGFFWFIYFCFVCLFFTFLHGQFVESH